MVSVIAACNIIRARAQRGYADGPDHPFQLLVESITGSWRVSRTISQFKHFALSLELAFPVEAGKRGSGRILPALPSLTTRRLLWPRDPALPPKALDEFLRRLLMLPPYISRSRIVIDFLLPTEEEMVSTGGLTRSISSSSHSFSDRSDLVQISDQAAEMIITLAIDGPDRRHPMELEGRHDGWASFAELDRRLRRRWGASYLGLAYRDPEGELIDVRDDEDLQIAKNLLGPNLEILALTTSK